MDIPATQVLPDSDDDGTHNLTLDLPTPRKRIHQVANLWIGTKKHAIFEGINKIGRDSSADIYLPDSTVSKNHAEIEAHANSAFVCDLESSNKTRLNNMVLRPQRFYQVDDDAQLIFGTVKARYLFLRGFDNSILVPETPLPDTRVRRVAPNLSKNLNLSLIDDSDEDSIIAPTQTSNDNMVFVRPSIPGRQKKIPTRSVRGKAESTQISIHDVATQPYVRPEDEDDTIYNCQTQKMAEVQFAESHESVCDMATQKFDAIDMVDTDTNTAKHKIGESSERQKSSIHEIETQILDLQDVPTQKMSSKNFPTVQKKVQSIYDMETQKFETTEFNNMPSRGCSPSRDELENIHNLETQKLDGVGDNPQNLDDAVRYKLINDETQGNKSGQQSQIVVPTLAKKLDEDESMVNNNVKGNGKGSIGVDSDGGLATSEDSPPNTSTNNHIINETDDESETDEEGEFSNIKIVGTVNDNDKRLANKNDGSDSETDEEGEFASKMPDCITSSVISNKYDLDEKSHVPDHITNVGHSQIPKDFKSSCLNERPDCGSPILAVQSGDPNADDDSTQLLTQIVPKIRDTEENDEMIDSDDDKVLTQRIDNMKKRQNSRSMDENEDDTGYKSLTPLKSTASDRKPDDTMRKECTGGFIPDGNDNDDDDSDEETTQIIDMPRKKMRVQRLSEENGTYVESSSVIPKPESETTKKDAQLKQPRRDGIHEAAARMRNPRIVIERATVSNSNVSSIIVEPRKTNCRNRSELLLDDSKENNGIWDDQYFDDTTPTQVIDVRAAKIQAEKESKEQQVRNVRNRSRSKNREQPTNKQSDDNNDESLTKALAEKPRVVSKSRKTDDVPLNDSVTENLANLFGGESEGNRINTQSPMATQILEEVLEDTDFDSNKRITRVQNIDDAKPSSSDTDSQDYFSKLRTKRKHNVILHSQDSSGSEGEDKIPSSTGSFVFAAGTSGFKNGVAIDSEERVRIGKSNMEPLRRSSNSPGNVKGEEKIGLSDNDVVHGNDIGFANVDHLESLLKTSTKASKVGTRQDSEGDDILAGLPEVRIYGTTSYPASPTSSVCSLDDLESFEQKRKKRLKDLAAKKAQLKKKSLCKVSTDSLRKIEYAPTAATEEKLEWSDDEELGFEDFKKLADEYIAADMKPKELSIKLQKMERTATYSSMSEDNMKSMSVSPTVKSDIVPQKPRGRLRKQPVTVSQNDEINIVTDDRIKEAPPRKRARLTKGQVTMTAPGSNPSSESHDSHMSMQNSILGEKNKRIRKVPMKLNSPETHGANNNRLTSVKLGKNRAKVVNSPSAATRKSHHKVQFTGLQGSDYEADIKSCGGTIMEKSEQATILVTDKVRRTNKFFCAISRHIPIVSENWIKDSATQKTFVDWSEYILHDPIAEAKYNFKLRVSLERASEKKLFQGFTFIVTPRVTQPGFDEIKSMVQMSGGKALVRAPKSLKPNTIIISCAEDIPKVQDILSKVSEKMQLRVHTVEFILLGILKQELDYTANQIELPED